ncbi:Intersectin 1 (SH3 domain protein) [Boothiomyces sp. JEL0866]|nr:Intersectin 1 (SH3 domain protein) [Boothiomyces sp. JEL0866]
MNLSFIDQKDLAQYQTIFNQHAQNSKITGKSKLIAAQQLQQILMQSGLPQHILGQIWYLSYNSRNLAIKGGTAITFPEFSLAMFLTKATVNGNPLPQQLPAHIQQQVQQAIQANQQMIPQMTGMPGPQITNIQMGLQPQMTGIRSQMTGMPLQPQMAGLQPQMAGLQPQMTGLQPQMTGIPALPGPQITNIQMGLQPQMTGMMPQMTGMSGLQSMQHSMTGSSAQSGQQGLFNNHHQMRNLMTTPVSNQWAVSPQEKQQYEAIFRSYDPEGTGFLSGDRARAVFAQSQLRENMLAHIWGLCDMQKRGKLNLDEFCVAMHLIYKKLNGFDLPTTLPPNLVPPSQRDLSALSDFAKLDVLQSNQPQPNRISPAASLMGISTIAQGMSASNSLSNLNLPEENEGKRQELVKQVEEQRRIIHENKEKTESYNKSSNQLEVKFQEMKQKALKEMEKLPLLYETKENLLKNKKTGFGPLLSPSEIDFFRKVSVEMPALITELKSNVVKVAERQAESVRTTFANNPTAAEPVVNKAAALLAERMAKLGVKSTLSTNVPAPLAQQHKPNLTEELAKIETEKLQRLQQIETIESRFGHYTSTIQSAISSNPETAEVLWNPSQSEKAKYEGGIGLDTKIGIQLYTELRALATRVQQFQATFAPSTISTPKSTSFTPTALFTPSATSNTPFTLTPSVGPLSTSATPSSIHNTTSNLTTAAAPLSGTPHSLSLSNNPIQYQPSTDVSAVMKQAEEAIRQARERTAKITSPEFSRKSVTAPAIPAPAKRYSFTAQSPGIPVPAPAPALPFVPPVSVPSIPTPAPQVVQTAHDPISSVYGQSNTFGHPVAPPINSQPPLFSQTPPAEDKGPSAMQLMREKEKAYLEEQKNVKTSPKKSPKPDFARPPSPAKPVEFQRPASPAKGADLHRPPTPVKPAELRPASPVKQPDFTRAQSPVKEIHRPPSPAKVQQPFYPVGGSGGPPPPPPPPSVNSTTVAAQLPPRPKPTQEQTLPANPLFSSSLGDALSKYRKNVGNDSETDGNESEWSGYSPDKKSPAMALPITTIPEVAPPVASGGPPPPPPPMPTLNSDGSVAAVKIEGTEESRISTVNKPKPKPQDVGAMGPNLFDLMKTHTLKKTGIKKEDETFAQATDAPTVNVAKSSPQPPAFDPLAQIKARETEKSKPATLEINNNLAPHSNPFSTTATPVNPFSTGVTPVAFNMPSITSDESWEVVSEKNQSEASPTKGKYELTTDFAQYEVVVGFDFQGNGPDDLQVLTGEVLVVEKEEGEWLVCKTQSGNTGYIPKTFVKTKEVEVKLEPIGRAKVLFDFEARNADEISVTVGQIVQILAKPEIEWWVVQHSDKSGLVPSNFLKEILPGELSASNLGDDGNQGDDGNDNANPFSSNPFLTTPRRKSGQPDAGNPFGSANLGKNPFGSYEMVDTPANYPEEKNRSEAVVELIQTERAYVEDLQTLVEYFYNPMLEMEVKVDVLFSNLLEILCVNSTILEEFENTFAAGEPIGQVYLNHLDDLECYKGYCENMARASAYLQSCRTENPAIHEFLKGQQNLPQCKHLDLSSFLLKPMQRITRYSLLLRQIKHYTPKNHPHHDTSLIAFQLSEEFLEKINNAVKIQESVAKIKEIVRVLDLEIPQEQYKLDLTLPTRTMGTRIFHHEGVLFKNKSGRKLQAYLFSDFLLLASAKAGGKPLGLYRKPLMLNHLSIRDAIKLPQKDTGDITNCSFQIIYEDEIITLRTANVSEKRQWINLVEAAIKEFKLSMIKEKSSVNMNNAQQAIGTVRVKLLDGVHKSDPNKPKKVFAIVRIGHQSLRSEMVNPPKLVFNQSFIFTIFSLDESLKVSLHTYDKYSPDEYLGHSEIQLDFLEYYGGKETEKIQLVMKDGQGESVYIQMMYRPT